MMVEKEVVNEAEVDTEEQKNESNHAVYKRQQIEWRKMKHLVAQLKKQRKALSKKQRDRKKELGKDIKLLIASTRANHDQELKDLGIVKPASARDDNDDDLMEDDDQ